MVNKRCVLKKIIGLVSIGLFVDSIFVNQKTNYVMNRKKIFRIVAMLAIVGVLIGGGTGLYMFFKPHRDVQKTKTDYSLSSSQIVSEYLLDRDEANEKYLAVDGDSKVLEITGVVKKVSDDYNGQKVVLLKGENDKAGVSATFTVETNKNASNLKPGQTVTIKGVIRSGAAYDEDLELYENVILEKSDIVLN